MLDIAGKRSPPSGVDLDHPFGLAGNFLKSPLWQADQQNNAAAIAKVITQNETICEENTSER
jgi:hypothetical protein